MTTSIEILLEEPSAEAALRQLMPLIAPGVEMVPFVFRGKPDLLRKLPRRLAGYASWAPAAGVSVVVLVDRDDDDCQELKRSVEAHLVAAGLTTPSTSNGSAPEALARLAVEELEAWFFGDVPALCAAFPGIPLSLAAQTAFREPDDIRGGTSEQLERVLQRAGYYPAGLQKRAAARAVAMHMDVENNRSHSFRVFRDGVRSLVKENA